MTIDEGVKQVNEILVECPDALTVDLVRKTDPTGQQTTVKYGFVNQTKEARKARKEAIVALNALWQGNATNYETLAKKLRVGVNDVTAALDAQFREFNWITE